MNKYVLDKRKSIIKLNTDTLDLKYIDVVYDIDYVWIIDEDGILIRSGKEYKVEKGDAVLLMYRIGNEKEGDLIIINNNDLNNYFERKKKFLEEMENAKRTEKVCSDCDLKCECTPNY
jgi:hypothetical protein